ncbi:ribose 5-phosphate isomerase B [Alphaproteobacteria bacterium]|nr:ribose 5-phosphate isomerase B [Alphaproteobacteria bacterium]
MTRKIFIASDHAGFDLKKQIIDKSDIKMLDLGANSNESVDYPDYASSLAQKIKININSIGILICGSGIGMTIAANRYSHIRAGLALNPEISTLMRKHNDANVLVLPGRFINVHEALNCVNNFMKTKFELGRHQIRIKKINNKNYE